MGVGFRIHPLITKEAEMLLFLNDMPQAKVFLLEVTKFFYDPVLYYTFIIVFVDFLFGVYYSWMDWKIRSRLFDRTADKLTKYTLTYALFHTLSLFPFPKLILPFLGMPLFDPSTIDDFVMFLFMGRETLSILESMLKQQKIAESWPALAGIVTFLGKLCRLAEAKAIHTLEEEVEPDEPDKDNSKMDGGKPGA